MSKSFLAMPRSGTAQAEPLVTIAAPKEADFVSTFGQLLPPASYLLTEYGKVAYYSIPPASPASDNPISRVLMVHGAQTCAIGLQPLAKSLSARFPHAQIVLVDLWGHGLTDAPVTQYKPSLFHYLLEALMAQLSWDKAHFIGFSFGGSTIATFAATRPHLISSLVLVAPVGLLCMSDFTIEQQKWFRGETSVPAEEAQKQLMNWLEGGPLIVPADWKEAVANGELVAQAVKDWQMVNHEGHAASVIAFFDAGAMNMHEEFRKTAAAGLKCLGVLGGADSLCTVSDLEDVGFKNVVAIEGAGHNLVREQVPEVTRFVEEFWRALS